MKASTPTALVLLMIMAQPSAADVLVILRETDCRVLSKNTNCTELNDASCAIKNDRDARAYACWSAQSGVSCNDAITDPPGTTVLFKSHKKAIVSAYNDDFGLGADCPDLSEYRDFSSEAWCADTATICWDNTRRLGAGVRLLFEPRFGGMLQWQNNKIDKSFAEANTGFGLEINLVESWLAFQLVLVLPFEVTFTESSPIRSRLTSGNGTIDAELGFAVGLSAFDGVVSAGYGRVFYDESQITNPSPGDPSDPFVYINWQPIATARAVLKRAK